MFIEFVDIDWLFFCVILTPVCSLRACHMWLTRNHMFIVKFGENLPRSFFEISKFQKIELGKFISKFPLKHLITSANLQLV